MKNLVKYLALLCMSMLVLPIIPAQADYVGRFAKYVTTIKSQNFPEVEVGTSETRVVSQDPTTHKYLIQITNQDSQGTSTQKTASFSTTELDQQKQGALFNHCTDNYGTLSGSPIVVKNNSFPACIIKSSNAEMDVGMVPFSVLKSISHGARGKIYTTKLVDYQE